MTIERTFPVEVGGIGYPDYSREISSGIERAGLYLKYGQNLKAFIKMFSTIASPFVPHVVPPLGIGATAPYMDAETGLDMPYTVPEGYTLSIIVATTKGTQNRNLQVYEDGQFNAYVYIAQAGVWDIFNFVVPTGTWLRDPTGASSHTFELRQENLGGAVMEGGGVVYAILEEVGTKPLPVVKTVKCKACGHEQVVPLSTSSVICASCGKLNIYYNLSKFKGTA